jgi:uncharacterized membrane protein YdbT with pleckstrin-like domain
MTETILYKKHPFPFFDKPAVYLLAIILIAVGLAIKLWIFLLACIVVFVLFYLKYLNTTLTITNERTTLEERGLSKKSNTIYHSQVGNIRISQNLIEQLLNLGDIEVATTGTSGYEMRVAGIPEPETVKGLIEERQGR